MYGLLLEGIAEHMKQKYGLSTWAAILKGTGVRHQYFSTHKIYSENLIFRLSKVAEEMTGCPREQLMEEFGESFVTFLSQYGYDKILAVLGRRMRDFLGGLDTLHDYLRFTYPRLKAPSFSTSEETKEGLTLTYRSKRRGYANYVKGQIRKVGRAFYNVDIEIQILKELITKDSYGAAFRLTFDNSSAPVDFNGMIGTIKPSMAGGVSMIKSDPRTNNTLNESSKQYMKSITAPSGKDILNIHCPNPDDIEDTMLDVDLNLDSSIYFEVFPFHVIFDKSMVIKNAGSALMAIIPDLIGQNFDEAFAIIKPPVDFRWSKIVENMTVLFELITIVPLTKQEKELGEKKSELDFKNTSISTDSLHVRGAMEPMESQHCMIFLGSPIMREMDEMFKLGLYINDLSMHDASRDLILAGTQHSTELKVAVEEELYKSEKITINMKKIDEEMKRTDQLLYQMIPKAVADRLRNGEPAINTCELFDSVTILFTEVTNFNTICSRISPLEVVSLLNNMYQMFDNIVSKHQVYKVETIADSYMVVAGAPNVASFHAQFMAEAAFDLLNGCSKLYDPLDNKSTLQVRFGLHTGPVVAGVVGIKMPRYCLFGDTVNTASRIQSSSEPLKIHISQTTNIELEGFPYKTEKRGIMEIKGKGSMQTYWLIAKTKSDYLPLLESQKRDYEAGQRLGTQFDHSSMLSMVSGKSGMSRLLKTSNQFSMQLGHGQRNKSIISQQDAGTNSEGEVDEEEGSDENISKKECTYNPVTIEDVAKSLLSLGSKLSADSPKKYLKLSSFIPIDDNDEAEIKIKLPVSSEVTTKISVPNILRGSTNEIDIHSVESIPPKNPVVAEEKLRSRTNLKNIFPINMNNFKFGSIKSKIPSKRLSKSSKSEGWVSDENEAWVEKKVEWKGLEKQTSITLPSEVARISVGTAYNESIGKVINDREPLKTLSEGNTSNMSSIISPSTAYENKNGNMIKMKNMGIVSPFKKLSPVCNQFESFTNICPVPKDISIFGDFGSSPIVTFDDDNVIADNDLVSSDNQRNLNRQATISFKEPLTSTKSPSLISNISESIYPKKNSSNQFEANLLHEKSGLSTSDKSGTEIPLTNIESKEVISGEKIMERNIFQLLHIKKHTIKSKFCQII